MEQRSPVFVGEHSNCFEHQIAAATGIANRNIFVELLTKDSQLVVQDHLTCDKNCDYFTSE